MNHLVYLVDKRQNEKPNMQGHEDIINEIKKMDDAFLQREDEL